MESPFTKFTLPNGLRVILAPRRASVASTVLVLVETGSEYETKKINGISHFLEHMMFKGTAKRPEASMISMEFDALGAESNAFTGEEYTGYWAKAESHKLPRLLELVADLSLNPLFDPKEIEKERGVIIEEINLYEDQPRDLVERVWNELLYGDQPAGWKIEGTKEVIRALTRADFVSYRAAHYVASKTIVVAAGAVDGKEIRAQIASLFGGVRKGKTVRKQKTKESQRAPRAAVFAKDSAQSHVMVGVRAFPISDPRRRAAQVLASVLGGGMSSRLFRKVREELGAAYYINSRAELFLDRGAFVARAGVDRTRVDLVVKAILGEMAKLASTPVPKEELKKAKDHMTGNLIMGLETSDELANFYGMQEVLSRRPISPARAVEEIKKVTAGQVQRLARELFKDSRLNLAVVGPHEDKAALLRSLRFHGTL